MLYLFWVIAFLLAALFFTDVRYGIRGYLSHRDWPVLTVYLGFLLVLGFLVIHLTLRLIGFIQLAQETMEPAMPTRHVSARLRRNRLL